MANNHLPGQLNTSKEMSSSEASREEVIYRIDSRIRSSSTSRETLNRILLQLEETSNENRGEDGHPPIGDTQSAKMQAFSKRAQGAEETDEDYLAALSQLATEAHLNHGRRRSYECYVASQFMAGAREGLIRNILTAMETTYMLEEIKLFCTPGYAKLYLENSDKDVLIDILLKSSMDKNALIRRAHVPNPSDNPRRSAKLLQFSTRVQGRSESEGEFLSAIEKLAQDAYLDECKRQYEGYVVSQFMAGVSKGLTNNILADMKTMPMLDEVHDLLKPSPFDLLFTRNIYQILEKIFFYLDYESYRNCFDVCRAWTTFLTSDTTFQVSKSVFGKEIWVDAVTSQNLGRIEVVPDMKINCWTTNGNEVAYMEDLEKQSSSVLHYIDENGKIHSVKLKERILHEKEGVRVLNRRCVKDLWILRNVILIGTYMSLPKEGTVDDGKVYSIDKNLMTKNLMCETTLFANFTNKKTAAHFSGMGLRLLSTKFDEASNVNVIWLRQVSMDLEKQHDWDSENDFLSDSDCCYSVKLQELGEDSTNKWTFSRDGTLIILAEALIEGPCNISAFATGAREKGWKVRCLWKIEYRHGLPDSLVTNSKYLLLSKTTQYHQPPVHVMYQPLIPNITTFHIVRLDNGERESLQPIKGESKCYELTERHLITFGKHGDESAMALIELETRKMKGFLIFPRDSWLDETKDATMARKISGTQSNRKICLSLCLKQCLSFGWRVPRTKVEPKVIFQSKN